MSSYYQKTTYNSEGPYGSTEVHTLYVQHNNTCDYVTIYDEDGKTILVIPDTIDNNILNAINRLYSGKWDDVMNLNDEDKKKLGITY